MERETVSVIIPVYKTEQYLKECMDSVLTQKYPELEIILVDDGSPDNCPALCDEYAERYENVKVVHQINSGLGLARNAGMAAACGEYVFFLDSDDRLDGEEALSKLADKARETGADIVVGCYRRFNDKMTSRVNDHHFRDGENTKTVDFRFRGFYQYGHLSYNWGKLYRRRFLEEHDLKCRAYPFTQDKAHNMACYACKPVYAFLEESVCLYRVNEESVTFRYKENYMPVWISIASDFHAFLEERGIENVYRDLTAFHIFFGSFFLVKQELQFKKRGIWESVKVLRRYGRDSFAREAMGALARGRYVREIGSRSWKIVIRGASILFALHLYLPFAAGIALLRGMEVDKRITKSRFEKKE